MSIERRPQGSTIGQEYTSPYEAKYAEIHANIVGLSVEDRQKRQELQRGLVADLNATRRRAGLPAVYPTQGIGRVR